MEYRWGLLLVLLAACREEPKGPFQVVEPEAMRFDTERIRREVDVYKTEQSPVAKRRMEKAFAAFDERVRAMESEVPALTDPAERELAERRIANLKMRRDLHWTRSQTRYVETETVKRAEPVAERVEPVKRRSRSKPAATPEPSLRVMKAEPVREWER